MASWMDTKNYNNNLAEENAECYEFRCRKCDNLFVGQMEFSKHKGKEKCLAQQADLMIVENDYRMKKTDEFLRSIYIRAANEEEEGRIGQSKDSRFYDWAFGPKNRYGMSWRQFRIYQETVAYYGHFSNGYSFFPAPPESSNGHFTFPILPPPPPPSAVPSTESDHSSRDQSTGIDPLYLTDEWHVYPEPPSVPSETRPISPAVAKDSVESTPGYGTRNGSPLGSEHQSSPQHNDDVNVLEKRTLSIPQFGTSEIALEQKRKRPAPGSLRELLQNVADNGASSSTEPRPQSPMDPPHGTIWSTTSLLTCVALEHWSCHAIIALIRIRSSQEILFQCTIPFGTTDKVCEFIGNTSEMKKHRTQDEHSVFECMQCWEKFCLKKDIKNHQEKQWLKCYRGKWTAYMVTSVVSIDDYPAVKGMYRQEYEGPRTVWKGPVDERDNKQWQKKNTEMDSDISSYNRRFGATHYTPTYNEPSTTSQTPENIYTGSKRKVLLTTLPVLPQVSQAVPIDIAPGPLQAPPPSSDDSMEVSPEQPDFEMSPEYDPGTYDPIPVSPTYGSPMDIVVSPASTHKDTRDEYPPIASSQLLTPSRSSSPESIKGDSVPSSSTLKKTDVCDKPSSKRQADIPPAKKRRQELEQTDILGSIMKSITRTQSTDQPKIMKKTYEQRDPKGLPRPICPSEKMLKRSISNSTAFASMNLSEKREAQSTSCASRRQNIERQTSMTGPTTSATPPTPTPTRRVTFKEQSPAPESHMFEDRSLTQQLIPPTSRNDGIPSTPSASEIPVPPAMNVAFRQESAQPTKADEILTTTNSSQSPAPPKKLKKKRLPPLDMSRRAYRTGKPVPYYESDSDSDEDKYITLSD
ncbi:hypothetical protein GCK72_008832 [Caenorhabditis remanei]|uniref:Uncharacterized protein n=1 Tax=Caenorhabditis remanei TaxID=31234 RepID=A0A6A5H1X3_CAERE|nr:hypothetical protein GCK72_008832 [Caenorhabditis remanei]KAF1760583.1 hypothetical protein GCK72_008832 [Caenorhabditis remanei]